MGILTLCPVYEYDYFFEPVFDLRDFFDFIAVAAFFGVPLAYGIIWWRTSVGPGPTWRSDGCVLALDDLPLDDSEASTPLS